MPGIQDASSQGKIDFFEFLSDLKDYYVFLPFWVFFLFIGQRSRAFYYLMMHNCIELGGAIAKLNYH